MMGRDIVFTAELEKDGTVLKSGMFAFDFKDEIQSKLVSLVTNGAKNCPGSKGKIWHEATLMFECNDKGEQTGGDWK